MANEFTINSGYSLLNGNRRENRSDSFQASQTNAGGPAVGEVTVATAGTDIDLSQITTPGVARFKNHDSTNFVEVGIREPELAQFYPFLELGPGESYTMKLSRNLRKGWTVTGTTPANNYLHAKADTAPVKLSVEVYEK